MRNILMIMAMVVLQSLFTICDAKKRQVINPDTLQVLIAMGDSCVARFDHFHALEFYKTVYDTVPSSFVARKMANVYRKMGRNKDCSNLLRSLPADSINYYDLRSLYFAYRSMEVADSLIFYGDTLIHINPYDSEVVTSMASYYNHFGLPERAALICAHYLQGDSTNMFIKRQFGYASYLMGKYEEAYKVYCRLGKEGFDNFESNFVIGISLEKMEDIGTAYDYLLKAAKCKDFRDYTTLYHLGSVCIRLGMNDEGIGYIKQAIDLHTPDSALLSTLHKEVARAYFNKHCYAEAAMAFEKSAEFKPNNPLTYYNIAQMYGAIGNREKEKDNYVIFLQKSNKLKDTDDNREMISRVKNYLQMYDISLP